MELKDSAFGAPISKAGKQMFDDESCRYPSGTLGVNDGLRDQGPGLAHDQPVPIKRKRGKLGFPKEGGGLPQPREVQKSAFGVEEVHKRFVPAKERRADAKSGKALPDGSFPMKTAKDVSNAEHDLGRTSPAKRSRAEALIARRKRALHMTP